MEKTDRHHSIKGCIRRRKPLWAGITLCLAIALTTLLSTCRNFGYISTKEEADTLRRFLAKGTACVEQRQADSALTYYSLVLSRYRPSMPDSLKRLCCKAANNMGYTYFFQRQNYPQSYKYYLRAIDLSEEIGDTLSAVYAHLNIGNVFSVYGNQQEAFSRYRRAFNGALRRGDHAIAVTCMLNMLSMYHTDTLRYAMPREIDAFASYGLRQEVMGEYAWTRLQAIKAEQAGHYDEAERLLRLALQKIDDKLSPQQYRWNTLGELGELMLQEGKISEGKRIMRICMAEARQTQSRDIEAGVYSLLADLCAKEGRWDSAYAFNSRMTEIKDSFFSAQNYGQIRDMESGMKLQRLGDQIRENETRHSLTLIVLWCILAGACVLLLFSVAFYLQNRRLKQRNRDLYAQARQALHSYQQEKKSRAHYEQRIQNLESKLSTKADVDKADATGDSQIQPDEHKDTAAETEHLTSSLSEADTKYQSSSLSETAGQQLLYKVQAILDNTKEILNPSFSIDRLARLTGSNYHYVSEIINKTYGKNFSALLGELRVRNACMLLADNEHYGNFTIEAVGTECGFKSRTNFVAVFKKVTGLTPSSYRKLAKEKKQEQ